MSTTWQPKRVVIWNATCFTIRFPAAAAASCKVKVRLRWSTAWKNSARKLPVKPRSVILSVLAVKFEMVAALKDGQEAFALVDDIMRISSCFPKGKEQSCRTECQHVISKIPTPSESNRIIVSAASFVVVKPSTSLAHPVGPKVSPKFPYLMAKLERRALVYHFESATLYSLYISSEILRPPQEPGKNWKGQNLEPSRRPALSHASSWRITCLLLLWLMVRYLGSSYPSRRVGFPHRGL